MKPTKKDVDIVEAFLQRERAERRGQTIKRVEDGDQGTTIILRRETNHIAATDEELERAALFAQLMEEDWTLDPNDKKLREQFGMAHDFFMRNPELLYDRYLTLAAALHLVQLKVLHFRNSGTLSPRDAAAINDDLAQVLSRGPKASAETRGLRKRTNQEAWRTKAWNHWHDAALNNHMNDMAKGVQSLAHDIAAQHNETVTAKFRVKGSTVKNAIKSVKEGAIKQGTIDRIKQRHQ